MLCLPKSCFRLKDIPDCLTTLKVKTTIVLGTVVLRFRAPNGREYVLRKATDADGIVEITLKGENAELPRNLFNAFAGAFLLTLDGFMFLDCNDKNWPCLRFSVRDTFDTETEYLMDLTDCGNAGFAEYSGSDFTNEFTV